MSTAAPDYKALYELSRGYLVQLRSVVSRKADVFISEVLHELEMRERESSDFDAPNGPKAP